MTSLRLLAIICIVILTAVVPVRAQWVQSNGPLGASISSIVANGPVIFAGSYGAGVFVSTDTGSTWARADAGLTNGNVNALILNPNGSGGGDLYAGTGGGGFTSTNNGLSWQAVPDLASKTIQALAVGGGGTTLWAGADSGLFRSIDGGGSWQRVDSGFANRSVRSVASIDGLSGTSVYAGTPGSVYVSTNNGMSWSRVDSTLNGNFYAVTRIDTTVFGAGSFGVYAVSPSLPSWHQLLNYYTRDLLVIANGTGGLNILAGSYGGGVSVSADTGKSWIKFNSGLSDSSVQSLAIDPVGGGTTYLFAGTFTGIFRTRVDRAGWTAINSGLAGTSALSLAVLGTNIFTGTQHGVYRSTDSGVNWTAVDSGLSSTYIPSLAVHGAIIFAGTSAGVYSSTDLGLSWILTAPGPAGIIYALGIVGSDLYAGSSSGVYKSTNDGASWAPINSGLPSSSVNAVANIGSVIFVGTGANGVYASTNTGVTWSQVDTGLSNKFVHALAAVGTSLFAGTLGGGVFRSIDSGATWSPVNSGLSHHNVFSFAVSGSNLFAGTDSGGIFLSTDNGNSWTNVTTGLPLARIRLVADALTVTITALAVNGSSLYAATGGLGVWSRPIIEMVTAVKGGTPRIVPEAFELSQNYPDPFNPATTISYSLPGDATVSLKIYNLLGKEIQSLAQGRQTAGLKSVVWNASAVPSGVYFYRLDAQESSPSTKGWFTQVRKMILLK
jgi:hypothetical protein